MRKIPVPMKVLSAALLPVIFYSCGSKVTDLEPTPPAPKPPVYEIPKTPQDTLAFIYSRTLGLDSTAVKAMDENNLLVDGDMTLPKSTLAQMFSTFPLVEAKDSSKTIKSPYVVNNYRVFKIGYHPGQTAPGVESALYSAIAHWNGILILNGAEFNFMAYSDPGPSDIMFYTSSYLLLDVPFVVSLPTSTGQPGASITLNTTYLQVHNITKDQLVSAMVHALGHILGLQHSDRKMTSYYDAGNIGDLESVMHANFPQGPHTKMFSKGDTAMVKRLFPAPKWPVQSAGQIKDLVGIEMTAGNATLYYTKDGKVVRGTWNNAVGPMTTYEGRTDIPNTEIAEIACSGANRFYAYFTNGWYMNGEMYKLGNNPIDGYIQAHPVPGQSMATFIGTTVKKDNDDCYYWYSDGTYSVGRSGYWAQYSYGNTFTVPTGKKISDIKAIASDDEGRFYFWYKDNTVSRSASLNHSNPEGPVAVKIN
ncbi:hypothetical protein ACDQ55_15825 [Chitinophaga sp. 30R24]|uniref:hypothetical protein n=1 Tax=Chitinophaga sp. 30R24 TaxID=3248838 RepID=UPI003B90FB3A